MFKPLPPDSPDAFKRYLSPKVEDYQEFEDYLISLYDDWKNIPTEDYQQLEDYIIEEDNNIKYCLPPWCSKCNSFHSPKEECTKPVNDNKYVFEHVDNIPDCCKGCPNHPNNGGSGICNCTLPYLNNLNNYYFCGDF